MKNILCGLLGITLIACGGGENKPAPATPSSAPSGGDTASPAAPKEGGGVPAAKADVMVIDWPAEMQSELEMGMKTGIAALHYESGNIKVLKCSADGNYSFAGVSRKDQVLQLSTSDEITANLPGFGSSIVKRLDVELKKGTTLDIAMVVIGRSSASKSSVKKADLKGDCANATHWVRRATVGAYSMKTGSKGQVKPVSDVFAQTKNTSLTVQAGSIDACASASPDAKSPPAQCSAPIRIELNPIE